MSSDLSQDPSSDEPTEGADDASEGAAAASVSSGRRRGKRHTGRRVAKGIGYAFLTLLMVSGLAVSYSLRHFQDNIQTTDYEKQLENRPEQIDFEGSKEPLNILVMGIDSRAGKGNAIDGETGEEASDTTILLHLARDRKHAYGVSIPRDTMVDRPDCKDEDLKTIPGESYVQWNRAYAAGGAGCTMQQFEQITGVRLDHSIVVDFNGFQDMVDAIGGVEVCVPAEVNDEAYGITLKAGTYEVSGLQALSYVRERHGVGDGSDIGRMQRQQAFIASMVNKAMSAETVSNPAKLYKFLNAATKSLKMDKDLADLQTMAGLAGQMQSIGMNHIKFFTIPWGSDPNDPNRVVFAPQAQEIWKYIRKDKKVPADLLGTAITAEDPPNKGGSGGSGGTDKPKKKKSDGPSPEEIAAAREQVGLCS